MGIFSFLHIDSSTTKALQKSQDPCNSGTNKDAVLADYIKRSLDKTLQTMQLLRQLRDTLSATLRAYNRFTKLNGDMCYFSDISDCSSVQNSIVESFEKLTDLLSRLCSLDDSCKRFATHVCGRVLQTGYLFPINHDISWDASSNSKTTV